MMMAVVAVAVGGGGRRVVVQIVENGKVKGGRPLAGRKLDYDDDDDDDDDATPANSSVAYTVLSAQYREQEEGG
jgi:hypothetical protein